MTRRDEPAGAGPAPVTGPGAGGDGAAQVAATGDVAAVVPAAGRSVRFGGGVNKVFRDLAGRPVLARSLAALAAAGVRRAVVALRPEDRPLWEEEVAPGLPPDLEVDLVEGGAEREDSVYAALARLAEGLRPPRWVLVHDAARPLARPELIRRVLEAARRHGAAVPAVPLGDTIKEVAAERGGDGDRVVQWVVATLPRHRLRAVQTPQGFAFDRLWEAHQEARRRGWRGFTDDAALLERLGVPVAVVPGDPANMKLTWPEDVAVAEHRLAAGDAEAGGATPVAAGPVGGGAAAAGAAAGPAPGPGGLLPPFRVGIGYDVHRIAAAAGRPLILGGVTIPGAPGLDGHSDADVVLHAAMDALLGAAGLPDIGHWFPPGDPRWAGAASSRLAAEVVALLRRHGWEPAQVDVSVVAEAPRLAPHVEAMRRSVAAALGLPAGAVGIKATTNEGLGFAGRREGIAALAVALIVACR
ncbi:2-C-methyl-D-erythritol 4-phosphate cytidylyltransferase [Thermaerobacter marianensis DSM 12885]|uniref:Bifunctional enzyme IspD/IspF n=1 Tax=Thermaerobacter marianensis (strain ATCC 700841 / DSM 12885 / JCM 10246 / 7p75a) TaxID=644966 RepID=E6SLF2_THEM7|nr:2-C-methyl-D-erythritol 4-phosphate cytidylyltransferase [Thermaerobacter marianensis]ADU52394.1 2-C-methyl-D-erythritol 4-phosphate cytidylyltransferase [Thermaerobacter marianensis DSM 12885]